MGGNNSSGSFLLARYNEFGTLDSTFGTGGVVISAFGDGVYPTVRDIAFNKTKKLFWQVLPGLI